MTTHPPIRIRWSLCATAAACAILCVAGAGRAEECEREFSSTFELIQSAIFENRGCTSDICHGSAKSGGLDLRAGASYDALVGANSETVPNFKNVVPGRRDLSLLWYNLAAKTFPNQWQAPLRPMPLDPLPALTPDELEAIRLWIESGAPRAGTVPGTDELLDACLPPPEPIEVEPLPPPAPGTGIQIYMPPRILPPRSESEVCFAHYYDVTDQVPAEFLSSDGTKFRWKRTTVFQAPNSHHLITFLYTGRTAPTSRIWGTFRCRGGDKDGQICDPTDVSFCGPRSGCATDPVPGVACIGYGPPDASVGIDSAGINVTQETAADVVLPDGVFDELPLKGMLMFNSHAFNLFDKEARQEAWLNFEFAPPAGQHSRLQVIFDAAEIFKMNVPPFSTQEVCRITVLPPNANVFELSSHTHKRGKRWRTFRGAWRCSGGPNNNQPCTPFGVDLASPDLCGGAPCLSTMRIPVGDCNYDQQVTVSELITSVNIALGTFDMGRCRDADASGDGQVTITDLIQSVNAALNGVPGRAARDPEESLIYVNTIYNDPVVLRFDPPLMLPGIGSANDDRAFTYCALYDNGFTNPAEVKRRSTSPRPPVNIPGFPLGGPCDRPTHCAEGKVGAPCVGSTQVERDTSCDTAPGAGDGFCDACPLRGGVTTEDEMYILLGAYYVPGEI